MTKKKDIFWNSFGTFLNASTSFFYLIIATRINGTNDAGIFTYAFTFTLLLEIIGYYAGRIYQVTEKNNNIKDNDYIYNHIITSIFMILIGFLFCVFKNYNGYKFLLIMVLLLFRAIESLFDSFYAIIQKNDLLYKVGVSFFLKAILYLSSFLIVDLITKNLILSSLSLIVSEILIIILYDLKNIRLCNFKLEKPNFNSIKYIFVAGFCTFLFTLLNQYVINSPKYAIDELLSNNSQTIYGIVSMPSTVILLLSQFLIHPYLLKIDGCLVENKINEFKNIIFKLCIFIIVFGMLSTIFCYFFGIPILEIIYNIKLSNYNIQLVEIIVGSTLFGLCFILSSALIAMRIDKMQVLIYVIQCFISCFISNIFINNFGLSGAFNSYLLSMFTLLVMYVILFYSKVLYLKRS